MSIATQIQRLENAKASIKRAIENKGVTVGNGTISTYASKIDQISTGSSGDDEWNAFWDNMQNYGNRTTYKYAFYGEGWNDVTFDPKHDFILTGDNANQMFNGSTITDFKGILEKRGVKFDTAGLTTFNVLFYRTTFLTTCPVLDCSNAEVFPSTFAYSGVETIDGLINIQPTATFQTTFNGCSNLKEIRFSGTVGQKGLQFNNSGLLSHDSIVSVINALSTTSTVSNLAVGFSKKAVNAAFETSEGANDGSTSDEWTTLVASRPLWTITLA